MAFPWVNAIVLRSAYAVRDYQVLHTAAHTAAAHYTLVFIRHTSHCAWFTINYPHLFDEIRRLFHASIIDKFYGVVLSP